MVDNPSPLLVATQFRNDPRIAEAKSLILKTLNEHQKKISRIRPPIPELTQSYEEVLNQFSNYRGGKLYFPYLGSGFGSGPLVELLDGSVKYDMISGIGPHYWGHSHPDLISSNIDAALSDTVMQGHLQQNLEAVEICELLIQASGLDHCFLSSSGAMANENALKLAFHKKQPAQRILAFEKCFMGRTLALSQVTDKPDFREGLPLNLFVDYLPFYKPHRPLESTTQTIYQLKRYLTRYPKQYAAMCFELVQGEGGFHAGTKEFFSIIMEILREHDITIIVDEVQTFGRTSHLFAYQHFGLDKYVDVVTIGKLSQVCATLFTKEFKPRPGLLSQTFTSSTIALHAAKFIIKSLLQDGYLGPDGKIAQIHENFADHFRRIESNYPHLIRGPYGLGSMIAFTPCQGDVPFVTRFIQELFQAGVISFIAGAHPARVRFLVPIGAMTKKDVDQVMHIVEGVLKKC
jgi:acetylornithine/N-succinyldiaminopimelate aminotransferase